MKKTKTQSVRKALGSGTGLVGVIGIIIMLVFVFIGPFLLKLFGGVERGLANLPPGFPHLLGTNETGRDVLLNAMIGGRMSLSLAFIVATITTLFALLIGVTSAYFGGKVDSFLTVLMNVFLVLPGLPLMVVLAAFLPPGPGSIIFVLSITGWAFGARLFRSQALSIRSREYISASRLAGTKNSRIIWLQMVPNLLSIVAAFYVNQIVYTITAEASLEFLGLGDTSMAAWGTSLFWAQNNSALLLGYWWQFMVPGFLIAITASCLVFINMSIDRTSNPRLVAQETLIKFLGTRAQSASLITPVRKEKVRED